ncbi:trafficking kinesin-binding protein 2 isoform X2 [Brienomyrus brachyistius]|uniref:trafficking kinesin-binding protein 2 isoform X2 n=1 Tax=Brienomyrus brachyistius TaxID=42636 RepID=UPI0020B35D02|nr:trafficking kinesin-binding protein 2 isoform X2 [Brienomyrus brachyistius]
MFEVKPTSGEKVDPSSDSGDGAEAPEPEPEPAWFGSECESLYPFESRDLVVPPCGAEEQDATICPVLAEETLPCMVLTADGMDQMARTHNDVDMVTCLLAERDRDLELAARIGQSLLQRNHLLQERNEAMDEQLAKTLDQVRQLQHELVKKDKLLRMVASASEESEADPHCPSPPLYRHPLAASLTANQLEVLQSKLQELEEENVALRTKACRLKTETLTYEEKEQELVRDCVQELRDCSSQMVALTDELSQRNEELLRHQEEIAQLLSQIVELQYRVKELALEKEELRAHLQASKDAQRQLTAELNELQEQNSECTAMLQESQEEIKELRGRSLPSAALHAHLPYGLLPQDSLAAEIEGSMLRDRSEEDGAYEEQRASQRRVFQAVRSMNKSVHQAVIPGSSRGHPGVIPGSSRGGVVMTAQPFLSTQVDGADESGHSGRKQAQLGQPGSPGGGDLLAALRRLLLRRQNHACELRFFQAEREGRLQEQVGKEAELGACTSLGGRSVSFSISDLSASGYKTFLPEKLQIVKPMEGSLTLHHWQQLAQPHLASILDPPPGVVTKGFRPLPQDTMYHLTDPEEDEEEERLANGALGTRWQASVGSKWEEEDNEEEEAGILFMVPCTSTPEKKMESRTSRKLNSSPPSPPTPVAQAAHQQGAQLSSSHSVVSGELPASTALYWNSCVEVCSGAPLCSSALSASADRNPGKCLSSTFSTYTFTTCRILHPSDVTQVTPSSLCRPLVAVTSNIPSSLRTGPSTPVTACQLSLEESLPPMAPCGLARILLEKGISAQCRPAPVTPPCLPQHADPPSLGPFEPAASSDSFLASRPAELFLQDVYGLRLGRPQADPPSLGLAERLQQLGFTKTLQAGSPRTPEPALPRVAAGCSLLERLRRNQSLPTVVGGWSLPLSSPLHQLTPLQHMSLAPTEPNTALTSPSHSQCTQGQHQA